MEDEQTNKTDTKGTTPNKDLETGGKDTSEYNKAVELVKRREEVAKKEEQILDRKEKLVANQILGGDSGGNIKPKTEDPAKKLADEIVDAFK